MACFLRASRWCGWLLWLWVALVVPHQLVGGKTVCRLRIEGFKHTEGVKSAALSCSGGTITAAAHPAMLGRFTRSFSGVSWSNQDDCGAWRDKCLLTICGNSSATFVQASIIHVNASTQQRLVWVGGHSKLEFHGATFSNNVGRPLTGHGSSVSIYLKSVKFINNTLINRKLGGGALHLKGVTAWVEDSSFEGNSAIGDGGAIMLTEDANLTIRSSMMRLNKGFRGGALAAEAAAHVTMHECRIRNNTALVGGGICSIGNTTGMLQSCVVQGNSVARGGGGLYVGKAANFNISATLIMHNMAGIVGGGLEVWDNASVLLWNNTKLVNNTAIKKGGAAFVGETSTIAAYKAIFTGNTANRGAGVYAVGRSLVSLKECTLSNNTGTGEVPIGVALCLQEMAVGNITRCVIMGNTGDRAAGLLVGDSAYAAVHNTTFAFNAVRQSGGALASFLQGHIQLTSCRLLHNLANVTGGCMRLEDGSKAVLIGQNSFIGNWARTGGCFAMSGAARLNVVGAVFEANSASDAGGVLSAYQNSKAVFADSRFTGGISQPLVRGGAFYISEMANLTLRSCAVSSFNALRGGGVAADGQSVLSADNVTFSALSATEFGGAIFTVGQARIEMTRGLVQQAYAARGGALAVGGDTTVDIDRVRLRNCTAKLFGGCMVVDGRAHITLTHCKLQHCVASNNWGGALAALERSNVSLRHCWVQGNTAATNGGGLYVEGPANLAVRDSILFQNSCNNEAAGLYCGNSATCALGNSSIVGGLAERGGGIALLGNGSLVMHMVTVHNNTARNSAGGFFLASTNFDFGQVQAAAHNNSGGFASDWFIMPLQLTVADNNTFQQVVSYVNDDLGRVNVTLILTGPQGLPSEGVAIVATLGLPNQAYRSHTFLMSKRTSESGNVQMLIKLRRTPGTYLLQFRASNWENVKPQSVTVQLLGCGIGEVTASSGDGCDICQTGHFSFNPANTTCDICIENAHCPGGALIVPNQGFWHSASHSLQVHRCFNAAACPGTFTSNASAAEDYKTAQCAAGYRHNLCALCQPGYGTLKPFTCRQCMKPAATIALYTLAAVVMLVAMRVLCALALADPGAPTAPDTAKPVDLAKPLVVYAQWLYIVANISGVPWPPSLLYPMQALGWFWSSASSTSLGLDCVLPRDARVPVPAQKVLFGLLMPLAILTVLLCSELAMLFVRRRMQPNRRHVNMCSRFTSMFVCMTFLFLPTWSHTVFSLFACVPLDVRASAPYTADAVGSYWVQDMSEGCYAIHGYHRYWALGLGLPLMLVCLMLPAGVFMFVWASNRRGKLNSSNFRQRYGFMYRTWREEVCWWEAVVIVQTITLVMVETFGYALGPYYQTLVVVAALVVIGVLLLAVKPHQSTAAGVVSLQSVGALFTTAFSSLTFLPYRNVTAPYAYCMAMGAFVLLVNFAFVLSALWKLLRMTNWGAVRSLCSNACLRYTAAPYCSCCKGQGQPRGTSLPLKDVFTAHWLGVSSSTMPLACGTDSKQLQETAEGSVGQHGEVVSADVASSGV